MSRFTQQGRISMSFLIVLFSFPLLTFGATQPACSATSITAKYPAPSLAPGFSARLVATGLHLPRSIVFDSDGHLLVLEQSIGITALTLNDAGGDCVTVSNKASVVSNYTLNHGLQISADGSTIYASNNNAAFSWDYNSNKAQVNSGASQTIVSGMTGGDHQTRTLLLSQKNPDLLLISRGSDDNIDDDALDVKNGHCMIKAFDVSELGDDPFNFATDGTLLGWGLRNSVGIGEHPITGGIFSVENSVDNIVRNGADFHQNDPGEELNFHGFLNGSDAGVQGQNYGYPNCVTAWNASEIPSPSEGLKTGSPIAFGNLSNNNSDSVCAGSTVAPRLTFQGHWAPLDILFNTNGTVGYMTSHGSSDRDQPIGYFLMAIPWDSSDGQPVAAADSQESYIPIMSNPEDSNCPDNCFRPVGLTWDSKGRLWMTSDTTGEIYVITTDSGGSVDAVNGTSTGSSGGSSGGGSSSPHKGAAAHGPTVNKGYLLGFVVAMFATTFLT